MPRLIYEALRIGTGVREPETKVVGMSVQPPKGGGEREILSEWRLVRNSNVNRPPRVVFAEAWGRHRPEYGGKGLSGEELILDDFRLALDAPKSRYPEEHNPVSGRCVPHPFPCARGTGSQSKVLSVNPGFDAYEFGRLGVAHETPHGRVVSRYVERLAHNDSSSRRRSNS